MAVSLSIGTAEIAFFLQICHSAFDRPLRFASRNSKGIYRLATYCYLFFLVLPRDICRYLLRRRSDLANAALQGVSDFCARRSVHQQSNLK